MEQRTDEARRDETTEGRGEVAPALADVVVAARRVITDRVDLTRMMIRADARALIVVAAYGSAAAIMTGAALVATAGAVVWALALWMPLGAALACVAVVCFAGGLSLFRVAHRGMPSDDSLPRALPAREAAVSKKAIAS